MLGGCVVVVGSVVVVDVVVGDVVDVVGLVVVEVVEVVEHKPHLYGQLFLISEFPQSEASVPHNGSSALLQSGGAIVVEVDVVVGVVVVETVVDVVGCVVVVVDVVVGLVVVDVVDVLVEGVVVVVEVVVVVDVVVVDVDSVVVVHSKHIWAQYFAVAGFLQCFGSHKIPSL